MSDFGDRLIEYEEQNWSELAEKFIDKHLDEWEQFVMDMFSQHVADIEPPEREDR